MVVTGRYSDLRRKWVVDRQNGDILGRVIDLEIEFQRSRVVSIVVGQRHRWWWPFGQPEEQVIPWHRIGVIGQDTLLVTAEHTPGEEGRGEETPRRPL